MVDRSRLVEVMRHIGVGDNKFFDILCQAMDEGEVSIVSNGGLSAPFFTSRGIR